MDKNGVKDFNIDDDEVIAELTLPSNSVKMGNAEDDDIIIYIKQDAYNKLDAFSSSDVKAEVGSALVGKFGTFEGKPAVIINGFIEAKFTDSTSAALTFTPETWAYLYGEREKKYPDMQIVGWHRTHPGDGASLSNYDMYIVENFFNTDYGVTYIIDPKKGQRGFYGNKNGRVVKMKGFNLYDDDGKKINIARSQPKAPQQNVGQGTTQQATTRTFVTAKTSKAVTVSLALIVVLLLANLASSIGTNMQYGRLIGAVDGLKTSADVNRQTEAISALTEQISIIGEKMGQFETPVIGDNTEAPDNVAPTDNVTPDTATPITPVTPPQTDAATPTPNVPTETPDTTETAAQQNAEDMENDGGLKFFEYTVKEGDYISLICDTNGIDYDTYSAVILEKNGIVNADRIEIGQVLLLPKLD